MSTEKLPIPFPNSGMLVQISLRNNRQGWYYGYLIGLGASPTQRDCESYQDGCGVPTKEGPHRSREEALYSAATEMREILPKLGLNVPSHKSRRQYITTWLDKIAPKQLELF